MKPTKKLNIKDWAEEDRPREKLLLKGVDILSDAELLAILIASGNRNETAVELSQRILYDVGNNLNELGKLNISDLCNYKGIGDAKAITIIAAMELARRRKTAEAIIKPQVYTSKDVYNIFEPMLADLQHEEIWVLYLSSANKVIKNIRINKGNTIQSAVDIRLILKNALDVFAPAIVLCHNHPEGNSNPSQEDDTLTLKLKKAAETMDIQLADHIIVGEKSYYSYRDKERL